jgi:hypothetical protein
MTGRVESEMEWVKLTHSKNKPEQNIQQLVTLEFCSTVFFCERREMTLFDDKVRWVGNAREQHPTMFIYHRLWVYRLKFEQPIGFCFPKVEFGLRGLSKFEFELWRDFSCQNGELMDSFWQLEQHGSKVGCTVKFGQFKRNFQLQRGVMSNQRWE